MGEVAASLVERFPPAAELLVEAEEDILAYMAFPSEHWRQLHSTNPLERLMREIGRKTDMVLSQPGLPPSACCRRAGLPASCWLAGAVLLEQQDERTATTRRSFTRRYFTRRYFSPEAMNKLYQNDEKLETTGLLTVPKT